MSKAFQISFAIFAAVLSQLCLAAVNEHKCRKWLQDTHYTCQYNSSRYTFHDKSCGTIHPYLHFCPIYAEPFNAQCWVSRNVESFFAIISFEARVRPPKNWSWDLGCHSIERQQLVTFTDAMTASVTLGTPFEKSSATSGTVSTAQKITTLIKNNLEAGCKGIIKVNEFPTSFTYENRNGTAYADAYSYAVGRSFFLHYSHKHLGKPGDETVFINADTYYTVIKGNMCEKQPPQEGIRPDQGPYLYRYDCEYVEITCPAIRGNDLLDSLIGSSYGRREDFRARRK